VLGAGKEEESPVLGVCMAHWSALLGGEVGW
jgi:hypothetical protein